MFKTVHAWFNDKWDSTGYSLQKIVGNILSRHPESSFSVSKLHRIFSNPEAKVSFEEVIMIAEGMDQDPNELLAIIGGQEYKASADVGYKGTAQLIAEFERREADIRKDHAFQIARAAEIREGIHSSFSQALDVISASHSSELARYDRLIKWWRTSAIIAFVIIASVFVYILWEVTNLDKGATAVLIQLVRDGTL